MTAVLMRLAALCMMTALSEQLTGDGRLKDGVRLIGGLLAAEMTVEMILALPGALFS